MSLFGVPVVKHSQTTLTFSTRKALALLVYLAVEGGLHTRKALSESFWAELDAEHGRAALRATLLELRRLFERSHDASERAHLRIERDTLGIEQDGSLLLDLRLVESASKLVEHGVESLVGQAREELLQQLEQAARLVRGDDVVRLRHLAGRGRERRIGRRDLLRMDQGLAVEAERAALNASGGEPSVVGKVEMHAV